MHKVTRAPVAANTPSPDNSYPDNSYMDLKSGDRLRILVPVLKPGADRARPKVLHDDGKTLTVSAENLSGYEVSYYSITGRPDGKVRLKFTAAEITKEGITVQEPRAPALPFHLPAGSEHIRLIYLIRSSQADHNMAIAASKDLDALNVFTGQLKRSPDVCKPNREVFCSWVPAGVAVRPEPKSTAN